MYKAILFAPDGDWVTDHPRDTIEEVQEALADQGSRWFFYPFHGVIRHHTLTRGTLRIVDAAEPFEYFKGYTIKACSAYIKNTPDEVLEALCQ